MSTSATLAAPSPSAGWLKNGPFDLSFSLGILALAAGALAVAAIDPGLFVIVLVADLWLLGYHHVVSTFTKLAGTREDRRRNRALIWYLLPGVLAATWAIGTWFGLVAIVTVYFFWQWFHYVRQSWGIAQRYRWRAGGLPWDHPRLSEATMWSVPVWGVLHRCYQNPTTFLEMPVWMLPVPLLVVQFAGGLSVVLLGLWVTSRVAAWRRGELAVGHTLFMVTHFVAFAVAYLVVPDVSLGWLMANVWHNAQYIAFVWLHNRQRFTSGVIPEAPVLSWLSQPGVPRAVIYFGVCVGASSLLYLSIEKVHRFVNSSTTLTSISFLVLFSMALNFHHYVVDGLIWKRRREVVAS